MVFIVCSENFQIIRKDMKTTISTFFSFGFLIVILEVLEARCMLFMLHNSEHTISDFLSENFSLVLIKYSGFIANEKKIVWEKFFEI